MGFTKPGYIVKRLKEPTTWAAVSLLAGYMGYKLDEQVLMGASAAVITIIGIFYDERR